MDRLKLSERLEILFWNSAIRLMEDRKAVRFLPILLFVSMCLAAGIVTVAAAGRLVGTMAETAPLDAAPGEPEALRPAVSNGQHNVLLVLVDQLTTASSDLQGVWLVLRLPDSPRLVFLPLYPDGSNGDPDQDAVLKKLFTLEQDGRPGAAFLKGLKSRDVWWDYYLVVDQYLLRELVDLVGGVDLQGETLSGAQSLERLPSVDKDPESSLAGQARLLDALCKRSDRFGDLSTQVSSPRPLLAHLRSDFGTDAITGAWLRLQAYGIDLSCEFPTLWGISRLISPLPDALTRTQ
jgi:hypothetical protein